MNKQVVAKMKLSVTRAQYGENDATLYLRDAHAPEWLTNPLTSGELEIQALLKEDPTKEEFFAKLYALTAPERMRDDLLARMKASTIRLKAQRGISSADARQLKADFLLRWASRMERVMGIPSPWIKTWMRDMEMYNAKGKLRVEFGGRP